MYDRPKESPLTPCDCGGLRLNDVCSEGCDVPGKDELDKFINRFRLQLQRGTDTLPLEAVVTLEDVIKAYDQGFIKTKEDARAFFDKFMDKLP